MIERRNLIYYSLAKISEGWTKNGSGKMANVAKKAKGESRQREGKARATNLSLSVAKMFVDVEAQLVMRA